MSGRRLLRIRNPLPVHRVGTYAAGGAFAAGEYLSFIGNGGAFIVSSAGMNATQGFFAFCTRMAWNDASEPLAGADYPYCMQWGSGYPVGMDLAYENTTNRFIILRNGSAGGYQSGSMTMVIDDIHTVIYRWTATTYGISVNGGAFNDTADTSTTAVGDATFKIGADQNDAREWGNYYRSALWGAGVLSNADASWINSLLRANHPAPQSQLPAAALVKGFWNCDGASYRGAA